MTTEQIIIKALDEETEVTCRHRPCDKPERENNIGACCHKCSLDILQEYRTEVYNQAIDDVITKLSCMEDEYRASICENDCMEDDPFSDGILSAMFSVIKSVKMMKVGGVNDIGKI